MKIQLKVFLVLEKNFLEVFFFLPYMGTAILLNSVEPFEQIVNIPLNRRTHMKSDENWLRGFREDDSFREGDI